MAEKNDIIFSCSENARIRIKDLAFSLGKSPQSVLYSVRSFEKDGTLYNPYCVFDYSYFGLVLFRVYFKGAYVSSADRSKLVKRLVENNYVTSVYELSGEFDLVIEMLSPNPSRFNKVFKELVGEFPNMGKNKIVLNVVTHLYPRFYLASNQSLRQLFLPEVVVGGDRGVERFSAAELSLMKALLDNPLSRLSALSDDSGSSQSTLKSLLHRLEEKHVIRSFKYILDTEKLGISRFRLFISTHNISREKEAELMNYFLRSPGVVEVHKTVGDWSLEVDIESSDRSAIRQSVVNMRDAFKDIIETFNIMEFHRYYKKSYLPKYLFSLGGA